MTEPASSTDRATGADTQALYRRFRAQTFSQMVGQDAVVQTLRNAVRLERLGHGFLFVGPRGTGKTSMARILAKAVNCLDLQDGEPDDACANCVAIREGRALDVIELDAASNNKVDDMRELVPRVHTAAADLDRKVFIIDEVQRIKEGWDVLLKTLEEPPEGVLFIFCTTDPSQIRPAVVSRLQRFTFRPLATAEIEGKLQRILASEGRTVEPDALALVARMAGGGMRDAESMLDQILNSADDPVTATSIRDLLGLADDDAVERFISALVDGDALAGIGVLDEQEAEGRDLVAFAEQLVVRLRADLVARLSSGGATDRSDAAALARAARRLTGIDASRSGLGGYRWQLELCLLGSAEAAAPSATPSLPRAPQAPAPPPAAVPTPAADLAAAAPSAAPVAPATPLPPATPVPPATAPVSAPHPVDRGITQPPASSTPPRTSASATQSLSDPGPGSVQNRPPAVATSRSPTGDDAVDIETIRASWPQIVEAIAANPANRPLVTTCRPVEMRDGALILGFPEDQAFMRDIAERKRAVLQDGIATVIGRSLAVRCVVTNLELVEPVDAGEGDLVSQARRIFEGELADVADVD